MELNYDNFVANSRKSPLPAALLAGIISLLVLKIVTFLKSEINLWAFHKVLCGYLRSKFQWSHRVSSAEGSVGC